MMGQKRSNKPPQKSKSRAGKRIPSVAEMAGSLEGYAVDDSKQAIREAYAQKYLQGK